MMKLYIEIQDYDKDKGLQLEWESGFKIEVKEQPSNCILIKANSEGLVSL